MTRFNQKQSVLSRISNLFRAKDNTSYSLTNIKMPRQRVVLEHPREIYYIATPVRYRTLYVVYR